MKKLGAVTCDEPISAQSVHNLRCFLAVLGCETIPEALFKRVAKPHVTWAPTGDLTTAKSSTVPDWLRPILAEEYSDARSRSKESILQKAMSDLGNLASRELLRKHLPSKTTEKALFDILYTAIHAFPEPYTEILWQEAEAQLWEVVESTCLPFLAIIDIADVLRYITEWPK
jgi:hypothetical protein